MRYGPGLAGNLKNLVSADHGAKHSGSAAGPLTTSGSAIAVEPSMTNAVAATMPPSSDLTIDIPPVAVLVRVSNRSGRFPPTRAVDPTASLDGTSFHQ